MKTAIIYYDEHKTPKRPYRFLIKDEVISEEEINNLNGQGRQLDDKGIKSRLITLLAQEKFCPENIVINGVPYEMKKELEKIIANYQ